VEKGRERARINGRRSRLQDPEKHKARGLDWKRKNPEKMKASAARWNEKNPGRKERTNRLWVEHNRERVNATMRASRKRRAAHVRAKNEEYRARLNGAPGFFTEKDVQDCLAMQGGRCFYCLTPLDEKFHIEHMTPLSRGGTNYPDNIVCACRLCNIRKRDRNAGEFILGLRKGDVPC